MIRILIADDQAMVRGALAALLRLESDLEVVAECGSGEETMRAAREMRPDVALLDIEIPGGDGLTIAARLREELPTCRVLILTTFGRPGYLKRAIDSGALGFLTKDAPTDQLANAIRQVVSGRRMIDPELAVEALSDGENPLTERERTVLSATATGASISAIASQIYLSEGTVRNYISTAIQKLNARNRIDAARIAREKGWL